MSLSVATDVVTDTMVLWSQGSGGWAGALWPKRPKHHTFFKKKIKVRFYLAKIVHLGILTLDPSLIHSKIVISGSGGGCYFPQNRCFSLIFDYISCGNLICTSLIGSTAQMASMA